MKMSFSGEGTFFFIEAFCIWDRFLCRGFSNKKNNNHLIPFPT